MSDQIEYKEAVKFVVAEFGKARLILTFGGRYELRDGTLSDLLEAREWASLFMPEAVVRAPVSPRSR